MSQLRCVTVAMVFGMLGGLSAQAADSPVLAFPQDTGVIVRLKSPQKTLQTAGELAVKVDRKEGVKVQLAGMPSLGMLISNPSLKGVDLNGDWWLGVFPVENGDPGVVFCIPATDADAMQKSVMGNYQFQKFEKWVIYTEHEATAAKLKTHLAAKGASISAMLDKTSTSVWDAGDLSVFVNVPQILKVYRGPFDQGVEKANQFIEQMPNLVPPQQNGGVDMKAIAELYGGLFKKLVQAVNDSAGYTAGLAVSGEGVALNEYARFSENSATAKALASSKPSALELLNQLPANRLGYGAAEIDMSGLMKWGMKFSLQMFAERDTEKEAQMKKLMAGYEKVHFKGMAMAFGLGNPKQGAMRAAAIVDVDHPDEIRKLSVEASKLWSNYKLGGVTMQMNYKPAAESYGDVKADVVRMKYEVDPQADPLQRQAKMNEILYGPEGMVTRTMYLKDRMVQSIGGDKPDAQALLDAVNGKNATGGEASFQATRKQLLPQANIMGLLDLPGTIASGMEIAIQAEPNVPFGENDIKTIRGEPSYLGFSLATEGHGLRAKTIVPVAQMQGVARTIHLFHPANQ